MFDSGWLMSDVDEGYDGSYGSGFNARGWGASLKTVSSSQLFLEDDFTDWLTEFPWIPE